MKNPPPLQVHYRILSVDEEKHSVEVVYFSDITPEADGVMLNIEFRADSDADELVKRLQVMAPMAQLDMRAAIKAGQLGTAMPHARKLKGTVQSFWNNNVCRRQGLSPTEIKELVRRFADAGSPDPCDGTFIDEYNSTPLPNKF